MDSETLLEQFESAYRSVAARSLFTEHHPDDGDAKEIHYVPTQPNLCEDVLEAVGSDRQTYRVDAYDDYSSNERDERIENAITAMTSSITDELTKLESVGMHATDPGDAVHDCVVLHESRHNHRASQVVVSSALADRWDEEYGIGWDRLTEKLNEQRWWSIAVDEHGVVPPGEIIVSSDGVGYETWFDTSARTTFGTKYGVVSETKPTVSYREHHRAVIELDVTVVNEDRGTRFQFGTIGLQR
jgi:hypothetical protein